MNRDSHIASSPISRSSFFHDEKVCCLILASSQMKLRGYIEILKFDVTIKEKACESGLPYCFLTDFTKFFLWGSMLHDFCCSLIFDDHQSAKCSAPRDQYLDGWSLSQHWLVATSEREAVFSEITLVLTLMYVTSMLTPRIRTNLRPSVPARIFCSFSVSSANAIQSS